MGKGGAKATQIVYTASVAVQFCEGPVNDILKIWFDEKLVWTLGGKTDTNIRGGVTIYKGTTSQTADSEIEADKGAGNVPGFRGRAYAVFKDLNLTAYGNRVPNITALIEMTADQPTLAEAITSICTYGLDGLSSSYLDVTRVTSPRLEGHVISGLQAPASILQPLMVIWQIDVQEVDGQVSFFNRTERNVITVLEGDLGATADGDEPKASFSLTDTSSAGTPTRIFLNYLIDWPGMQNKQATVISRRITAGVPIDTSIDLPIPMTENHARKVADRLLWDLYHERLTCQFSLPGTYSIYEGDLLVVPYLGTTYSVRVMQVDRGANYVLIIQGVVEAMLMQSRTEPDDMDGEPVVPPVEVVVDIVDPIVVIADVPYLRDVDNTLSGIYLGACLSYILPDSPSGSDGRDPEFRGMVVYISYDGGTTYVPALSGFGSQMTFTNQSTIGKAVTELADGTDRTTWDTTNDVTVVLKNTTMSLSSTTEARVTDDYANVAYCGPEVLGYVNATLESPVVGDTGGRYTLDKLARGVRNTAMTGHAVNELFLVIDNGAQFLPIDRRYIGETLYIKVVPSGQALTDVTAHSFVFTNNASTKQAVTTIGVTRTEYNTGDYLMCDAVVTWEDPQSDLHAIFGDPGDPYATYMVGFWDPQVDLTNAVVGTGTITFTAGRKFVGGVGTTITIEGVTPSGYDGDYTIASFSADYKSITVNTGVTPGSYSTGGTATAYGAFRGDFCVVKALTLTVRPIDQIINPTAGGTYQFETLVRAFNADRYKVKITAVGVGGNDRSAVAEFTAPNI